MTNRVAADNITKLYMKDFIWHVFFTYMRGMAKVAFRQLLN